MRHRQVEPFISVIGQNAARSVASAVNVEDPRESITGETLTELSGLFMTEWADKRATEIMGECAVHARTTGGCYKQVALVDSHDGVVESEDDLAAVIQNFESLDRGVQLGSYYQALASALRARGVDVDYPENKGKGKYKRKENGKDFGEYGSNFEFEVSWPLPKGKGSGK